MVHAGWNSNGAYTNKNTFFFTSTAAMHSPTVTTSCPYQQAYSTHPQQSPVTHTPQVSPVSTTDAWTSYLNSLNALQGGGGSQPPSHHGSMQDLCGGSSYNLANLAGALGQVYQQQQPQVTPVTIQPQTVSQQHQQQSHQPQATHVDQGWLNMATQGTVTCFVFAVFNF